MGCGRGARAVVWQMPRVQADARAQPPIGLSSDLIGPEKTAVARCANVPITAPPWVADALYIRATPATLGQNIVSGCAYRNRRQPKSNPPSEKLARAIAQSLLGFRESIAASAAALAWPARSVPPNDRIVRLRPRHPCLPHQIRLHNANVEGLVPVYRHFQVAELMPRSHLVSRVD